MATLDDTGMRRAPRIPPLGSTWSTMQRVFEHRFMSYRRTFRASLFSSFGIPVLFLTAMGFGLGGYVDATPDAVLAGLTYLQFLAPGLLAATVMQAASFESTIPILGGLQWNKIFHAMFATPIRPRDVVLGNLAWITVRLLLVASVFAVMIVLFGASRSWLIVFAVPAAVLTGLAFGTPIMAFTATQRTPDRFAAIFRFGITPLFLFSGTFFPIESLPSFLQPIAWLSPLWHGADLCRQLMLGTIGNNPLLALIHLAILVTITVTGAALAFRTVEARLVKG
ncbi:MAG TPA: ABC transporter permease [Candidatus Limnocylindria bacterium]|nr:ABC transporter permease [Candidatus Limnocylindria bacterium]